MATHLARVAIERDRAQEALRTSEAKYRDLVNTSPDAIYVIDQDTRCVLSNAAGAELAACPLEELIGFSLADTHLPEDRHLIALRRDQLKADGALRFERKFLRETARWSRWKFPYQHWATVIASRLLEILASAKKRKKPCALPSSSHGARSKRWRKVWTFSRPRRSRKSSLDKC